MKIAVIGTRGFPGVQGGVEAHCEQLYPRLVERGCEVIVFTRKPYVNGAARVYRGVTLIPLPCPRQKYLEAFVHSVIAVFQAKQLGADAVHLHAIGPALVAPLARALGMRVIMTHHGPDYEREKWGWFAKRVLRLGEYVGSRWSHRIICISEAIAQDVRRKTTRMPIVIPNGVVIPERTQTKEALRWFGVERERYILAVGRFVPEKGFHDLIEAFRRMQAARGEREVTPWKLVIAGCADHEDRYSQSLAQKAASASNVILTGFLTGLALQELYSHAGLFVLPSYYEGLPLVLLEAMSYGLPCLVSDIPATRTIGLPDECYFRPGNVASLTDKLQETMGRGVSAEARQAPARQVTQRYNWETIVDRTLEIYQSMLCGEERSDPSPWQRPSHC